MTEKSPKQQFISVLSRSNEKGLIPIGKFISDLYQTKYVPSSYEEFANLADLCGLSDQPFVAYYWHDAINYFVSVNHFPNQHVVGEMLRRYITEKESQILEAAKNEKL